MFGNGLIYVFALARICKHGFLDLFQFALMDNFVILSDGMTLYFNLIENDNTSLSLGKFQISPEYDDRTQSISLSYTDGDTCGTRGSKYSANITFKCSPGRRDRSTLYSF